jgi:hypothetical protein
VFERLHLTSGESAGDGLRQAGLPGDVLVWRDLLYDGRRPAGWPTGGALTERASFLRRATGGALEQGRILESLTSQYGRLEEACARNRIVLWFDACLFDQAMLAHVLTCLRQRDVRHVDLLCVGAFPCIEPFHGLGQLSPGQFASLFGLRTPVTDAQFRFAAVVDRAFADQDAAVLADVARSNVAPLTHMPAAARRWLEEQPDPATGLGRLESLALDAVRAGCDTPASVYAWVAAADTPPQFWGDTTLWAKLNGLAERRPPLVTIDGPSSTLPQFHGVGPALDSFRLGPVAGLAAS